MRCNQMLRLRPAGLSSLPSRSRLGGLNPYSGAVVLLPLARLLRPFPSPGMTEPDADRVGVRDCR